MARRRAPKSPPPEVQRRAAGWRDDQHWGEMRIMAATAMPTVREVQVDLLAEWALRHQPAAARIASRGRGRPVGWERMVNALRWLKAHGITTISDAPGSRCVKSLGEFLDQARTAQHRGERDSTAEELAGTLLAIAGRIEVVGCGGPTAYRPRPPDALAPWDDYSTS